MTGTIRYTMEKAMYLVDETDGTIQHPERKRVLLNVLGTSAVLPIFCDGVGL